MSKTCLANTKKGERCSRSPYIAFYCNQHWKLKIFNKWTAIVSAIAIIGGVFGVLVDGKEILSWVRQEPEEKDYWVCEQDNNIRGVILKNIDLEKSNTVRFGIGVKGKRAYFKGAYIKGLEYCFFPEPPCDFYFSIDHNNRLLLSLELYDEFNCLVGKIERNEFILNQNCQFTWNMDDKGFEVVDSDFNVVISIDYEPLNILNFQAIFPQKNNILLVYFNEEIDGSVMDFVPYSSKERLKKARSQLKPIFEYFGKDWFGKRASIN